MNIRNFTRQFRFVRKPSSRMTKIAVAGAVAISCMAMLALHAAVLDAQADRDAYRQMALELEQENSRLESQIGNLGTAEGVEQIAKDELDLVDPDTVIIEPEN